MSTRSITAAAAAIASVAMTSGVASAHVDAAAHTHVGETTVAYGPLALGLIVAATALAVLLPRRARRHGAVERRARERK